MPLNTSDFRFEPCLKKMGRKISEQREEIAKWKKVYEETRALFVEETGRHLKAVRRAEAAEANWEKEMAGYKRLMDDVERLQNQLAEALSESGLWKAELDNANTSISIHLDRIKSLEAQREPMFARREAFEAGKASQQEEITELHEQRQRWYGKAIDRQITINRLKDALVLISDIAEGSGTVNSFPHIAKICRNELKAV